VWYNDNISEEPVASICRVEEYLENGGTMFLKDVCNILPDYVVSCPREE
jgi:hypothetical protein